VAILDADRWPLVLSREQFAEVTGLPDYPPELASRAVGDALYYAGNNSVTFTLRGVHVKLATMWEYESPGGDTHAATAIGSKATVTVHQTPGDVPQLFVGAADPQTHPTLMELLRRKCAGWQREFPGVTVEEGDAEARLVIPDRLRTGHEAHFAEVFEEFVRYFNTPRAVPPWERTNLFTKYFITTTGVALARQKRPYA
jgi:hypothetical protein